MVEISELKRKGLIEALGLSEDELFEAEFNLLGFFNTLHKIDERLKREKLEEEASV